MRQEGANVRGSHKIKKTAADVEGGGDWTNALPDEVLQHVMSFLPAKQAVRTCVLARRWRHLWKSMPVLRVFHPRIMKVELHEHNDNFSLAKLPLISQRLTSFPALEALWMKFCYIDGEKISSQSLKELTMIDCIFFRQFRISAPSLVRLEITDCVGKAPVLEIMPSLVKAFIRFRDSRDICGKEEFGGSCTNASCDNCGANGVDSGDCVLLKGISMAKSLELVAEPGAYMYSVN
uniref:F-box domain-containing protein n=1 Tax=Oryza glaberrima TaxID=4538 RepID=I1QYF2_ORYGL